MYKNCKRCNIEKEIISFCKNQSKKNLQPLCSYTNRYIKKDNINYGEF